MSIIVFFALKKRTVTVEHFVLTGLLITSPDVIYIKCKVSDRDVNRDVRRNAFNQRSIATNRAIPFHEVSRRRIQLESSNGGSPPISVGNRRTTLAGCRSESAESTPSNPKDEQTHVHTHTHSSVLFREGGEATTSAILIVDAKARSK